MQRLTARAKSNNHIYCLYDCRERCEDCKHLENMIEKLTNYEDLEEELIAHTGMNLKDWIKHTTSMFNE